MAWDVVHVPRWWLGLPGSQGNLLGLLRSCCDEHNRCHPSNAWLAREAHISSSNVDRTLRDLEGAGLISRSLKQGKRGCERTIKLRAKAVRALGLVGGHVMDDETPRHQWCDPTSPVTRPHVTSGVTPRHQWCDPTSPVTRPHVTSDDEKAGHRRPVIEGHIPPNPPTGGSAATPLWESTQPADREAGYEAGTNSRSHPSSASHPESPGAEAASRARVRSSAAAPAVAPGDQAGLPGLGIARPNQPVGRPAATGPPHSAAPPANGRVDWAGCSAAWNQAVAGSEIPRVTRWPDGKTSRKAKAKTRAAELHCTVEQLVVQTAKATSEAYLVDAAPGWFSLDWALKSANNLAKLLDGNYRRRKQPLPEPVPSYFQPAVPDRPRGEE